MTPFDPGMSLMDGSKPIIRAASGGLSTSCLGLLHGLRLARMRTSCFFSGHRLTAHLPNYPDLGQFVIGSVPPPPKYCTRDCRSQFPLLGKIVQLILAQNESNN